MNLPKTYTVADLLTMSYRYDNPEALVIHSSVPDYGITLTGDLSDSLKGYNAYKDESDSEPVVRLSADVHPDDDSEPIQSVDFQGLLHMFTSRYDLETEVQVGKMVETDRQAAFIVFPLTYWLYDKHNDAVALFHFIPTYPKELGSENLTGLDPDHMDEYNLIDLENLSEHDYQRYFMLIRYLVEHQDTPIPNLDRTNHYKDFTNMKEGDEE